MTVLWYKISLMAEIIKHRYVDDLDGSFMLGELLHEKIFLNTDDKLIRYGMPKPYEYADITQELIDPEKILPTAKYVLRSHLDIIEALDIELSSQGINIFNLRGIAKIDENNLICPPILEVWEESPYNGIPVVVDGAHRLYIARKRGIKINCVIISGQISSMLPVLPLTGWQEVMERDEVPSDKRNYHPGFPENWKTHEAYRTKFPGSTGPRTISNKDISSSRQ